MVEDRLVGVARELAPLRRDRRLGDALDQLLALAAVTDEVGDGDEQELVLRAEALQIGQACHVGLLLVDHLAQHAGRVEAGHARQVDGRLGVTGALEHTALAVAKRVDVTGACEVAGTSAGIDERLNRGRAVEGRDAGARALPCVDRDRERGAVGLGVHGDHQRQIERVEAIAGHGHADHAGGVLQEECDLLRRGGFRGHDEIALVLALLIVGHDHDLAPPYRGDRIFDPGERHQLLLHISHS